MVTFSSCNDFLDKLPDERTEVNSAKKIKALLVSAYPTNDAVMLQEISSDNATDNGSAYTYDDIGMRDAYLWKDITTTSSDDPQDIWDGHFIAIASANQALESIKELNDDESLKTYRAEALLCRAYGYFALANTFCMAYNPETATKELGLPYSKTPETTVKPDYKRGTMTELYANIYADIEEALPLIEGVEFTVPKYHFNKSAAYAFAAEFCLFYDKFDESIKYANVVLGSNPSSVMRDWKGIYNSSSNWEARCNMYINADSPANLLLLPIYSSWGYMYGPYDIYKRYGLSRTIFENEAIRAKGVWSSIKASYYPSNSVWGFDQKMSVSKFYGYFEYTDKASGTGHRHNVMTPFTTNKTLLMRAEAEALNNDLDAAVKDINIWLRSTTSAATDISKEDIVTFMNNVNYMPTIPTKKTDHTIKKELNPQGFTVNEGDQEAIIQCILHLKRCEAIHEGDRWMDIKRYGIEISHEREGMDADVLKVNDPRRAIQLPLDVIVAGLKSNPRN